ncbi:DUF2264 domain-containing protein [Vibrio sp. 10N.222.49.A3]|uniref:DUF2264 domain-containing protein n=1 Tax=unclassified Vibrio TaxID=2614977 RepID=UPI003551B0C0
MLNFYIKMFLIGCLLTSVSHAASADVGRERWIENLNRMADPVLVSLSEETLKKSIPNIQGPFKKGYGVRSKFAPLEAFGRLMAGMAPWLELGPDDTEEGKLREKYILLAHKAVSNAVNPQSPDYMNFDFDKQPLVDSAYLAQAFLRAPKQLWQRLPEQDKQNVIVAMRKVNNIVDTSYSNWLLFGAMVETFLLEVTGEAQVARIEFGVVKHMEWYVGDGFYSDGPEFHRDYYNSYVIQPMLIDILTVLKKHEHSLGKKYYEKVLQRSSRYAAVLERMISPEGTYPIVGRSSVYRFSAFQSLAQMALMRQLPKDLPEGQVRAALSAVMERFFSDYPKSNFDKEGWLKIGVIGEQINQAEPYISSGSVYMNSLGFLVLGLPAEHSFWTSRAKPWTQKRIWAGEPDVMRDGYFREKK